MIDPMDITFPGHEELPEVTVLPSWRIVCGESQVDIHKLVDGLWHFAIGEREYVIQEGVGTTSMKRAGTRVVRLLELARQRNALAKRAQTDIEVELAAVLDGLT